MIQAVSIFATRWLSVFALLVFAAGAGAQTNISYTSVWPGLDYGAIRTTNGPWSVHVVRLERSRDEFSVHTSLAQGTVHGLGTVTAQTRMVATNGVGVPVAAVNGDFFVISPGPYQGDPLGLHIAEGELVSGPGGYSFWVGDEGRFHLDEVHSRFSLAWPNGQKTSFGLNEARKTNQMVLYTPALGRSTRTVGGVELVLEHSGSGAWLPLRADETYHARVREIRAGGDAPLEPGVMILSIGPGLTNALPSLSPGSSIQLSTTTSRKLSGARAALGGLPFLVKGGVVPILKPQPRHPRTAIGWNEKYFYMVVVDGRQPGLSIGMTFHELADWMKMIGCTEAMNVDGGGSSTLWLDGKVVNSPSDKRERSVANALVIVRR